MEKTIKQIEVLTPNEGMYLTQANRSENDEPIMSKKVINPQGEWIEIPIEEGDRIVAEWQAEQERKMREEDARMQAEAEAESERMRLEAE